MCTLFCLTVDWNKYLMDHVFLSARAYSAVVRGGSSGAIAPLDFYKCSFELVEFREFGDMYK